MFYYYWSSDEDNDPVQDNDEKDEDFVPDGVSTKGRSTKGTAGGRRGKKAAAPKKGNSGSSSSSGSSSAKPRAGEPSSKKTSAKSTTISANDPPLSADVTGQRRNRRNDSGAHVISTASRHEDEPAVDIMDVSDNDERSLPAKMSALPLLSSSSTPIMINSDSTTVTTTTSSSNNNDNCQSSDKDTTNHDAVGEAVAEATRDDIVGSTLNELYVRERELIERMEKLRGEIKVLEKKLGIDAGEENGGGSGSSGSGSGD
ncbi:hypothetical protein EV182_006328, partial [Spiromyces aspiralis]